MRNSRSVGLGAMIAFLVGTLFFNTIIGVFGMGLATASLATFVVGAVVVCRLFPARDEER